jgi:hypothetical protein
VTERKLLIVSPHFPPTDSVEMHRVRMNLQHYLRNGFQTVVLCVNPDQTGFLSDERLVQTVPNGVAVIRVNALPLRLTRVLGITDIAIRAMPMLARAGDEIIARERTDLVFFSTTRFHAMRLGVRWKQRFGVPFVLDFQDPWFTAPPSTIPLRRRGVKHALMRSLHARAEAATAPHASGLIAVSEPYVEALRKAYPVLRTVPSETIPFGYSMADFEMATNIGEPWRPVGSPPPFGIYAGRISPAMTGGLKTLFDAMQLAARERYPPLSQLVAGFVGTGYERELNPSVTAIPAEAAGVASRVVEKADRLSLFDTLASLRSADLLLLFGSDDLAYQPSKLYQLMATRKPILCIAPSGSRLSAQVRHLNSIILLESDLPLVPKSVQTAAYRLSDLLTADREDSVFRERDSLCAANEATTLAGRECALFDLAMAHHAASAVNARAARSIVWSPSAP